MIKLVLIIINYKKNLIAKILIYQFLYIKIVDILYF